MHPVFTALVVVVPSLAFVMAIGFFAIRAERARKLAVDEAWRKFGDRTGWRFHAAAGPWFHRRAAWVAGELDGATCRLEQQLVRRGKSTARYTRLHGRLPGEIAAAFEIKRRSFWTNLAGLFGSRKVATGDARFDAAFVVRAKHELAADSIGESLRESLLAFPKRLELRARDREVAVRWYGTECDPATLDAGHAILARLCRASVRR